MRTKTIRIAFLLIVIAALLVNCACSETWRTVLPDDVPMDSEPVAEERFGDLQLIRLISNNGETMMLLLDYEGLPMCLITEKAAPVDQSAVQTADEAMAAVRAGFPNALIIQVESEGALKAVCIVTPHLFGTVWTNDGQVVRRDLRGGCFISNGRLTLDGACHIAQLLHPEAEITAIEYDSDDDAYEGDALVDGVEYDLELDAQTGKQMEWERD